VGVVGLGRIGQAVARRCQAFGLTVHWWGPTPKPDQPWQRVDTLVQLARDSDILVVCAKLDDTTRGMISAEVLDALGPAGLLVNVARGGLVDEPALIERLKSGRLGGAALDVFEHEPTMPERWADVPNTVLTPHTAGATGRAVQQMLAMLLANLDAYFSDRPLPTPIPG
jgi:hydroxypyruvate reductase